MGVCRVHRSRMWQKDKWMSIMKEDICLDRDREADEENWWVRKDGWMTGEASAPPRSLMEKLSVLLDSVGMLKWMGEVELLWSLSVARITCTTWNTNKQRLIRWFAQIKTGFCCWTDKGLARHVRLTHLALHQYQSLIEICFSETNLFTV